MKKTFKDDKDMKKFFKDFYKKWNKFDLFFEENDIVRSNNKNYALSEVTSNEKTVFCVGLWVKMLQQFSDMKDQQKPLQTTLMTKIKMKS